MDTRKHSLLKKGRYFSTNRLAYSHSSKRRIQTQLIESTKTIYQQTPAVSLLILPKFMHL
jgi:hypothetical protein